MTEKPLENLIHDIERYETMTLVMDHIPTAVGLFTLDGKSVYMNREFRRIHMGEEYATKDIDNLFEFLKTSARHQWAAGAEEYFNIVKERLKSDGVYDGQFEIGGRIFAIHDIVIDNRYVLTSQKDITERILFEREMAYRASHDALTGLANRASFEAQAERLLSEKATSGGRFSVLMADLDHFKEVNDSLGHAAGDLVLQEVACRFRASLGRNDFVARLGGDEFIFLCNEEKAAEFADALAQRLVSCADQPIDFEGHALKIGVSVGYAVFPDDGKTLDCLKRSADTALYAVKSTGRGSVQRFHPMLEAEVLDGSQTAA